MMKADGTLASNQEESAKFFKDHFEKNVFEMRSLATMTLSSTKLTRFHATKDLEIP
jgi:hypothetical protein